MPTAATWLTGRHDDAIHGTAVNFGHLCFCERSWFEPPHVDSPEEEV
jgi:hypothetical protein